jgi:guanine deaminase
VDRLGYAITPRFAPSCSEAQLTGAGELAARYPEVWIQSHVSENLDEVRWARELFPASRSYLAVYDDHGLMRERAVYAHCIHFDDDDRALMRDTGTAAAVSPTSNLFLGSGFFDYAGAERVGFRYGLASDVGGGTSFSPFHTMLAAYTAGREGQTKAGLSLSPQHLWWQHTAGAAQALGLGGVVGNLQPGRGGLHRAEPGRHAAAGAAHGAGAERGRAAVRDDRARGRPAGRKNHHFRVKKAFSQRRVVIVCFK